LLEQALKEKFMKMNPTIAMTAFVLAGLVGIPQANAQTLAGHFEQIHEFSKRAGCGKMSDQDAAEYAKAAISVKFNVERFKKVYNASCAFKESMEAVKDEALADIFQQVLKMSKSTNRCNGLTGSQALQVAQAALKGQIKVHYFAVAYHASCSFDGPFAVAHMMTGGAVVEGREQDLREIEREEAIQEVKPDAEYSKEDQELKERWIRIESRTAASQSLE
jgi:hypothetical protein